MELKKYKLGDLVEVTRGMSLSGQFYSETGTLIRLTLGNFNMNGGAQVMMDATRYTREVRG